MNFFVKNVIFYSLFLFLSGCFLKNEFLNKNSKIKNNHLSTSYVNSLIFPKNFPPLLKDFNYQIPKIEGKNLFFFENDTRPPSEIILLHNHKNIYSESNFFYSKLFFSNIKYINILWDKILIYLSNKNINLLKKDNKNYLLVTDWIIWPQLKDKIQFQTRQKIKLEIQDNQVILTITNYNIRKIDINNDFVIFKKEKNHYLIYQNYYNVYFLNELIIFLKLFF
ncbi:MAG: outer membrane protein assembly factor BamC [Arsenophonus sp.]|nr:MAG: outer membrane protein assembly factor BamC [Arsenophonus sp.]